MPTLAVVAIVLELGIIAVALVMQVMSGTIWREDARNGHVVLRATVPELEPLVRDLPGLQGAVEEHAGMTARALREVGELLEAIQLTIRAERGSYLTPSDAQNMRSLVSTLGDRIAQESAVSESYRGARDDKRDALVDKLQWHRARVRDAWTAIDNVLEMVRTKERDPRDRIFEQLVKVNQGHVDPE